MDYKIYPTDGPNVRRLKAAYAKTPKADRDREPWMDAYTRAVSLDAKLLEEKPKCASPTSKPVSSTTKTKA
jgi:hypothetical protein